jgi:hypothetical protein
MKYLYVQQLFTQFYHRIVYIRIITLTTKPSLFTTTTIRTHASSSSSSRSQPERTAPNELSTHVRVSTLKQLATPTLLTAAFLIFNSDFRTANPTELTDELRTPLCARERA